MKQFLFSLAILASLFLLGCGSDSNPVAPEFPTEAEVETLSFELMNQERVKAGLHPLVQDPNVAAVARTHSKTMRDRNYFAHNDPSGSTPSRRLRAAGISFRVSGENIARTQGVYDPARFAHNGFMSDSTHRNVLLNPDFTHAGVGVARSGNDYWITQDFIGQ